MHHFNFDFSAVQIIWTLTFAALLVLLVVLLGRDRARRFPWFTASIVLTTLDMLGKRLLHGRMPQLTLAEIFITLADLGVLVGLLVVVEMARSAFAGAKRSLWIVNILGMLMVAGLVLAVWGPWPAWKTLTANSQLAALGLMQFAAQKGEMLVSAATRSRS
jgi:energy-converting hydrogenase Eha subunit A